MEKGCLCSSSKERKDGSVVHAHQHLCCWWQPRLAFACICLLWQIGTHLLWIRLWWLAQGYGPQLNHGSWMFVLLLCPARGRVRGSTYMRLAAIWAWTSNRILEPLNLGRTEGNRWHSYTDARPPWRTGGSLTRNQAPVLLYIASLSSGPVECCVDRAWSQQSLQMCTFRSSRCS